MLSGPSLPQASPAGIEPATYCLGDGGRPTASNSPLPRSRLYSVVVSILTSACMRWCRDSINCYQPSSTVGFVTESVTVGGRLGEGYQGPSLSPCQVKGACPRLERTAALRRSCGVCFQPMLAINSEKMPKSCWRHASAPTDKVLRVLSCGSEWGRAE